MAKLKSLKSFKIVRAAIISALILLVVYFILHFHVFGLDINFFSNSDSLSNSESGEEVVLAEQVSVFEDLSAPIFGEPKKIVINSIGINANVVPVGVDREGYLETPTNWDEVGWYVESAKVAEPGNLVINAHYDNNYGQPAVFWKLKNIKVGDKVSLFDNYNRVYEYRVSNIYYIEIDDPERSKVFEYSRGEVPVATLITCGGVWSPEKGTYDKRLVVNAELISDVPGENDSVREQKSLSVN